MKTNYEKLTDRELITLVRENEENARITIFDRYHVLLFHFVLRRINDVEHTKALVSEVFDSEIFKRKCDISCNLLSYFFEYLIIGILDYYRKKEITQEYIDKFESYIASNQIVPQHSTFDLIKMEVSALPECYKSDFLRMQRYSGNNIEYD